MEFIEFAKLLQTIEDTSSRNEMTNILASFLENANEDEVQAIMYMLIGRVVPVFVPFEFNFSSKMLARSLAKAYKLPLDKVNQELKITGDIGILASQLASRADTRNIAEETPNLLVNEIYQQLYDLAAISGKGAQDAKMEAYTKLVRALDPLSMKYVSRIITGKLRLGISERTIIDALSVLMAGDKSQKAMLEYAYGVRADIAEIAKLAKKNDAKLLANIEVEPGIPVASKLVQREKSVEAVFERAKKWIVQPKYDGLRTQIHFSRKGFQMAKRKVNQVNFEIFQESAKDAEKESVRIFSRNMEPLTDMFPDIVKAFENLRLDSVVLDAETIGYDAKADKFFPFQETMTRKRKYGVSSKAGEVPIRTFVFDILFLNGKDVTQLAEEERLKLLKDLFDKELGNQSTLQFSKSTVVSELKQLDELFNNALKEGLEGVITKLPDSKYKPGTRNFDWIKLKANIDEKLIDTIDCVVLGYYYGRGARAKFGAGAFLVGVYNDKLDRFETIAKVGSGIKDEEWPGFVKQVEALKVDVIPKNVLINKVLLPDIVCRPEIVVVVDADEITKSANHTAGIGSSGKGYSLRFPRLKEWNRRDKSAVDVTTVEEIQSLL